MGTDIHLFVEVYDPKTRRWKHRGGFPCETCNGTGKTEVWRNGEPTGELEACWRCVSGSFCDGELYGARNYDVFAMLADVRNGRGFAGIMTGEGFIPISPPKGMPKGLSARVQEELDNWGMDGGHSHSWVTLAELDDYSWEQFTTHVGVVDARTYAAWRKAGRKGPPRDWSGDVGGGGVVKVSNEEMDRLIDSGELSGILFEQEPKSYFTTIRWSSTYADCARRFLERVELLRKIEAKPEHIRLVLWFDS